LDGRQAHLPEKFPIGGRDNLSAQGGDRFSNEQVPKRFNSDFRIVQAGVIQIKEETTTKGVEFQGTSNCWNIHWVIQVK
jgi:hypothetical protein